MTRATTLRNRFATATAVVMLLATSWTVLAGGQVWRSTAPSHAHRSDAMAAGPATEPPTSRADAGRLRAMLDRLPLYFVKNGGQEDPRVAYYVQGRDTALYFGVDGVTFALTGPAAGDADRTASAAGERAGSLASRAPVRVGSTDRDRTAAPRERWAVKLDFVDASRVTPIGQALSPAVVSYFRHRDGQRSTSSETYRSVVYPELWPGIDLVYTGAGGRLKSTFVVKPGADPSRIRLAYRGATDVRVTGAGQLEVSTPVGAFADDRPYAYQDVAGRRTDVQVAFALDAATGGARGYGFALGAYDTARTLMLDPTVLLYAGYIGGTGADDAQAIAVDAVGNAYVVGSAMSTVPSFPTKIGPDLGSNGDWDVFVAKVNPDGSDFVYLGYIGGSGVDTGTGIAVDAAGHAYVTGYTTSNESSFPVLGGPSLVHRGGSDAFVAKVKQDGTGLVYCGYIGGTDDDLAWGIDLDTAGNAYVTGTTLSDETSFPVQVGPRLIHGGGADAFVAKVRADGSGLAYAGYIGGAADDGAYGIAVDTAGNAYVAGETQSDQLSFPIKIGPDLNFNGITDGFVAKVKADGSGLAYAGYIGGAAEDRSRAIAVDSAGNAYVAGSTASNQVSFPVSVGPDLGLNGGTDAFVAKVKADGSGLAWAGYIGGAQWDDARAIGLDGAGNVYVAGMTGSDESTFPVSIGPSTHFAGAYDAFVARVKPDGTGLIWAGYVGGAGNDFATGLAVDSTGNVYITGSTSSSEATFPVTLGPDVTFAGGGTDGFVAKISGKPDLYATQGCVGAGSAVMPGGKLSVCDSVVNGGLGNANSSTTRYYLSKDVVKSADDILLIGGAAAPALVAGTYHAGSATVTVPTTTPLGIYHVIACADDTKVVAEANETNNCSPGSNNTVTVDLPDLTVSVSNPPSVAKAGDSFAVTDITANSGAVNAPATTTRYYLSTDTSKAAGDILLSGSRSVAWVSKAGSSQGTVTVTIPSNTPNGVYYLLACADDLNMVKEKSEANNCSSSATQVVVTLPDLATTAVWTPSATVQRGHSFSVVDTLQNFGWVGAGASTTRYYLSKDGVKDGTDLSLTGSRAAGALSASSSASGGATVTVPSATTPAVYYLFACADDLKVVKETLETNNCIKAAAPITVMP